MLLSSQFIIMVPHVIISCQTFVPTVMLWCELYAHRAMK